MCLEFLIYTYIRFIHYHKPMYVLLELYNTCLCHAYPSTGSNFRTPEWLFTKFCVESFTNTSQHISASKSAFMTYKSRGNDRQICQNCYSLYTFPILFHLLYKLPYTCEICGSYGRTMKVTAVWDMTPCSLLGIYQSFGGICCFHFQDRIVC